MKPTVTKLHPSGAFEISDIVQGRLFTRVYFGYSRRDALAQFKQDAKTA